MLANYYDKVIYPLQDKALVVFKDAPFYLTGGTALSRGYYYHRYSDDLDYFLNDYSEFQRLVERQIEKLAVLFTDIKVAIKDANFCRVFVSEERLKIEMINDVPSHIGAVINHPVLGVIDSKENILANKLTAVVDRTLPKDIVDIYFLLKGGLNLKQSFLDASSKAAGISPLLTAKIFAEFDYSILDAEIKWINFVSATTIKEYLNNVSLAIVKGQV